MKCNRDGINLRVGKTLFRKSEFLLLNSWAYIWIIWEIWNWCLSIESRCWFTCSSFSLHVPSLYCSERIENDIIRRQKIHSSFCIIVGVRFSLHVSLYFHLHLNTSASSKYLGSVTHKSHFRCEDWKGGRCELDVRSRLAASVFENLDGYLMKVHTSNGHTRPRFSNIFPVRWLESLRFSGRIKNWRPVWKLPSLGSLPAWCIASLSQH